MDYTGARYVVNLLYSKGYLDEFNTTFRFKKPFNADLFDGVKMYVYRYSGVCELYKSRQEDLELTDEDLEIISNEPVGEWIKIEKENCYDEEDYVACVKTEYEVGEAEWEVLGVDESCHRFYTDEVPPFLPTDPNSIVKTFGKATYVDNDLDVNSSDYELYGYYSLIHSYINETDVLTITGHEVGHMLGLSHVEDLNTIINDPNTNTLKPSSETNLMRHTEPNYIKLRGRPLNTINPDTQTGKESQWDCLQRTNNHCKEKDLD